MYISLAELFNKINGLGVWIIILAIIFIPLERLFAQNKQQIFRNEFWVDFAYYFVNSLVPTILLAVPLAIVAKLVHRYEPSIMYTWSANLSTPNRLLLAIVVGEFFTYWMHRWQHEVPWLWKFHAIHHSAKEMDWLVNTRAHPLDMFLTRLSGLVPLYMLGLAQISKDEFDLLPMYYTFVGTIQSFLVHANVSWRFGLLELIISTPAFHHWHHANDGSEFINKNYAAIFPWMDKLFGSFYLPKHRFPKEYGIDAPIADSFIGQILLVDPPKAEE